MMSLLRTVVMATMLGLTVGARRLGAPTTDTPAASKNIVELAESVPELSTLVKLVVAADLATTLSGTGPFTVFAPTNDAFDKLGKATLEKLLEPANKAELVKILTYHVAAGSVKSTDLTDDEQITTVEGANVTAHIRGSDVFINDAQVESADNLASNGVVHIVGTVLMPPAATTTPAPTTKNIVELAESVPDLSILVKLVVAADLATTLSGTGPFTVFAPTNEAFEKLGKVELERLLEPANKAELAKILTYHVAAGSVKSTDLTDDEQITTVEGANVTAHIRGSEVFINEARVESADNLASNGVVHIVGSVLLPPAATTTPAPTTKNIVELAESVPELSTLVKLVVAADLATTLSGTGPFTVFAPSNDAFDKLGKATLEKLLEPANKAELVKILTYHVASGNVQSKDLKNDELIKTVEGSEVIAHVLHDGIFINEARVITADAEATNGVAHIVDAVLMPRA